MGEMVDRQDQESIQKSITRAGQLIVEQADAIIDRWVQRVGVAPTTSCDHRAHLRDHLPELLQRIGRDLQKGRREQGEATEEIAEKHGRQRWQLGWKIEGVVDDYQSLRPVLEEELTKELGDPLPSAVVSRLATLIDQSIADSLKSYAAFQAGQQDDSHRTASESAAIVASSTDAVISMSTEGEIQSWNQAAEDSYGYSGDEALGRHISLIVPQERRLEVDHVLDAVRRNEAISAMDTVRQGKDGARRTVAVSVSPICDRSGAVIGAASIERDVSEQARTAEALRRALDAAESAVQAKTEFLANVSHELRTPMNAVLGMISLAREEQLSATARDNLATAQDAASVMLNLVNNLLDSSKFESGQFEIDVSPFSLRRLLDETMRLVAARAVQKGLEVSCRVDRNVPDQLRGDALRLQQIITNLVDNGVKFTDSGEVSVNVSLHGCDQKTCDLEFTVRDTGVGISEDDQQRIFAPFMQVDASSTRRFAGAGLGLAIVSHLVRALGGELDLESERGVGSVFRFLLRLGRAGPARDDPDLQATAQQLRGIPILIVDHNAANREIVAQMLRIWGMQPLSASDADEALSELANGKSGGRWIEVVLIDALLPDGGGFDLADRIAQDGDSAPLLLLMISSSNRLAMRERCQKSAVDGFIDKPVGQSRLFDGIVGALSGKNLRTGGQNSASELTAAVSPIKALVVEDTQANRKVVTQTLAKRGHQFTVAVNGQEAVDRFQGETFDVVLMDVQMPVMDGLRATQAIRDIEAQRTGRATPIIAMTAHAMRGDRERCLAAGMDGYIVKPIDVRTLIQTIERVVGSNGSKMIESSGANQEMRQKRGSKRRSAAAESIDLNAALKRLRGDQDLLRELIECFFEDYTNLLSQVENALDENDFELAARASHNLKGLSANFNAQNTPDLAAALQQAASKKDRTTARELLPLLQQAARDLAGQLDASR